MSVDEIRSVGRATMGVRLVRLDDGATVVGFDTVADNAGMEEGENTLGIPASATSGPEISGTEE